LGVIGSLWADIETYSYKHNYKTEKHEALLRRIIEMATDDGDTVLDCFLGSGTTAAVAQQLGRRWIAADINKGAIQTTTKRLQGVFSEQIEGYLRSSSQQELLPTEEPNTIEPAQLSFSLWRVNDYDLQNPAQRSRGSRLRAHRRATEQGGHVLRWRARKATSQDRSRSITR